MLGVAEPLDALVRHLPAVRRPARTAHPARDHRLDPPVGMPDSQAAPVSAGAAHVADAPPREPGRRELRLLRRGVLDAFAGGDVHRDELGAGPPALRQIGADGIGLVEQQAPAVGRPRRTPRHPARTRQAAQPGTVRPDEIDAGGLQMLPLAGLVPGLGVPIRGEGDPRPVGRPAGPEVARRVVGEIRGGLRRQIQQPDVRGATRARGDEGQGPPVRRQGPLVVERGVVGELLDSGAVRVDPIDVRLPVRLGGEDDPLPVGGEGRGVLETPRRDQRPRVGAVGVGDEHGHHRGLIPVEQHLVPGRRRVRGRVGLRAADGVRAADGAGLGNGLRGRQRTAAQDHRHAHRQHSRHHQFSGSANTHMTPPPSGILVSVNRA